MYGYNQQQIIRVNGENGARMYQMMPNSSALLLDETAPLIWVVQTDGAGYKTCTPYKIERFEPEPAPNYKEILNRLTKLEEKINESDYSKSKQQQKQSEQFK